MERTMGAQPMYTVNLKEAQGRNLAPGFVRAPSLEAGAVRHAPQPVHPAYTPVWANWMVHGSGIGMPPSCPQMTGGMACSGFPQMNRRMTSPQITGGVVLPASSSYSQMTGGVASSGSAMPMGSFTPTYTQLPNEHRSLGHIQQPAPSQPVLYAASLPVNFLQAPGLPHIQTQPKEFSAQALVSHAVPPQNQVPRALGLQPIQTRLDQLVAQAPVHHAMPPSVQVLQTPGLQPIQTRLDQLAARAPVHHAMPPAVQVLQTPGPQHSQKAPGHHAMPPAVQVLQTTGPQHSQNAFTAQPPVYYAAPPSVQVKQTPYPQPAQTQLNQITTQSPVHYAAPQPVKFLQGPGPNIQKQMNEALIYYAASSPLPVLQGPDPQPKQLTAQAPAHNVTPHPEQGTGLNIQNQMKQLGAQATIYYVAPPLVQVRQVPGPQTTQNQMKHLPAQVPIYFAAPPFQVPQVPGPQPTQNQMKQLPAQAPFYYATAPPIQVPQVPGPQTTQNQMKQLPAQGPVHYATAPPVQGVGPQHSRNAQLSVHYAASQPVQDLRHQIPVRNTALLPGGEAPLQYFEAARPEQIAPVQPQLVPDRQHIQVQELSTHHNQNQKYLDENQNFPTSDIVHLAPVEQWVVSRRGNSESDEGISSIGESVETSPHTPKPKAKGRSLAAQVKQYKRLLTFQEKLVIEKGLPKSRLQVEFESGISLISPQPAHELGIKPISTAPPLKPDDDMSMGNLDGFDVYPRNLLSSKPSLDFPPVSDHLKPEQIFQPVLNKLKPAGTEGQRELKQDLKPAGREAQRNLKPAGTEAQREEHLENQLGRGQGNIFPGSSTLG